MLVVSINPRTTRMGKENHMKTKAWHSRLETDRKVYHDNTSCTEGNNIEDRNRVDGTGGRPRCKRCDELS